MNHYAPLTVPSSTFLLLRYKEYTYIYREREWKRNTTFEVQKQHSNSLGKSSSFSNFLSTFLLLSYKQRWREKKEQNSETVASRNTDMKGKHCIKEWRKLFLEWNRVLNRTKLGLGVGYTSWLLNMCYGQIWYRSSANTQVTRTFPWDSSLTRIYEEHLGLFLFKK